MLRVVLWAALLTGFVWLLVIWASHGPAPVVTQQPIETAAPEYTPAPVVVHKGHVHATHLFHGEHCPEPWIKLPGSVTCEATGMQYLVDENAWSVLVK